MVIYCKEYQTYHWIKCPFLQIFSAIDIFYNFDFNTTTIWLFATRDIWTKHVKIRWFSGGFAAYVLNPRGRTCGNLDIVVLTFGRGVFLFINYIKFRSYLLKFPAKKLFTSEMNKTKHNMPKLFCIDSENYSSVSQTI